MNRKSTKEKIYELFNKLRKNIPSIILRTTFILGFPNEQEDDFNEVLDFINTYKLQNIGFFKYSREEGTRAFNFDNQIDENIKEERLRLASQAQYEMLNSINKQHINQIYDVIIDESYDVYSIGRFYGQSPQIDSCVFIDNKLNVGEFYKIKINEIIDYDLKGELYEYSK